MDIDVRIDNETHSVTLDDPYKFDSVPVFRNIIFFGDKCGVDLIPYKIDKLILRMIRGVAGCEGGCPADAQSLVREGFGDFDLAYIEGGILTAVNKINGSKMIEVKIFPDFD